MIDVKIVKNVQIKMGIIYLTGVMAESSLLHRVEGFPSNNSGYHFLNSSNYLN